MTLAGKTVNRIAGTLLVLMVLLALLALAAPKLLNLDRTRRALATLVQESLGGDLRYDAIDITFFPTLTATVRGGELGLGDRFRARWQALKVRPNLMSLLSGSPRIEQMDLTAPEIRVRQQPAARKAESPSGPSAAAVPVFLTAGHDLKLNVTDGILKLELDGEPAIRCWDLNGRLDLKRDTLAIQLSAVSDAWRELLVTGQFHPESWQGSAQLTVQQLNPERLAALVGPEFAANLGPSVLNGRLQLALRGKTDWTVKADGTLPVLTLRDQEGPMVLHGERFSASVRSTGGNLSAELKQLVLAEPAATFSGRFAIHQSEPRYQLALSATDADLTAIRPIALRLFSRHRVARGIFDVLRSGEVQTVTFESRGNNRHEIGDRHHFVITGRVHDSDIHVPKVDLDLEHVTGSVIVQDGILKGTDLTGQMGESRGTEGQLTLDLTDRTGPFFLDLQFDARLSPLPALLSRLVKSPSFVHEMGLIKQLDGRAQGRLIIGDRRNDVHVQVDVRDLRATSRYRRIPFPIRIDGGGFHYQGKQVGVSHLRGILGGTDFQDLSASVDWNGPPQLRITALGIGLDLQETFGWLVSYPVIRKKIAHLQRFQGHAQLAGLEMNGPVLHPAQWQFKIAGTVRNFAMAASFLPATLRSSEGSLSATPETLDFKTKKAHLLDTTGAVSGTLTGYLRGVDRLRLRVRGKVQPKTYRWCGKIFNIPKALTLRAPFYVSKSLLQWERAGKVAFTASVAFPDGPDAGILLTKTRSTLRLERLAINDAHSRAEFSLTQKKSVLDVRFKGQINGKTLDRMLAHNDFLTGSINGKMNLTIPLNRWSGFTANGVILGRGVNKPWSRAWARRWPFTLDNISIKAEQNILKISSAVLNWDGAAIQVSGQVRFSEQTCVYDLEVNASELTWEQLLELAQPDIPKKSRPTAGKTGAAKKSAQPSVRGTIQLRADRFHYGAYTWEPFQADLSVREKSIRFRILNARTCGIETPGSGWFAPGGFSLRIDGKARHQPVNATLSCFWGKKDMMDGAFDLDALFTSSGKPDDFWKSLGGKLKFSAQNGRIYRFTLLSKILALINVTEIVRGRLPDLVEEGFAYNTMAMNGPIRQGKLTMNGYLVGASMRIAWQGECDLQHKTVDMTVLVAPLKTVDSIVQHIPIVNKLFKGSVVSIPVKVSGPMDDPEVVPVPVNAVGNGILSFIERTLKLPLTLIQPLLTPTQ